jgi:ribonuclease Y
MLTSFFIILCLSIGLILGVFLAKSYIRYKNQSLSSDHLEENLKIIFQASQAQRELILEEAQIAAKEQFAAEALRLEEERNLVLRLGENTDLELNKKQSEFDILENKLEKRNLDFDKKQTEILEQNQQIEKLVSDQEIILNELSEKLESKAGYKKEEFARQMTHELVDSQKLLITRMAIDTAEQFKIDVKKTAHQALNSIYFRYQPKFVWPKSSFLIQVASKNILEKYFGEESSFVKTLVENTDSTVSVLTINDELPSMLKISGGLGTDKEVIRLTLEEIISRNAFQEDRIKTIFDKHKKYLDKFVLKMGEDAIKILGLKKSMHPEILKLIGSLNYRTSHRQNQYYHSLEVARLAGMIADEVGVDCELAKRSGILHDIGKVLDYKIEGSHAVISGDYAMRFGEDENVVDTVLAHHDDKAVETPFAYILKAADAMSGARPGARVDMEEGYNRRIDGISGVVNSFADMGVVGSGIMYAGREVHIYVDNARVKQGDISDLANNIAKKLEAEVEYPGQIRVTVIRRTEVTEVA